jgi:hypothetical protein
MAKTWQVILATLAIFLAGLVTGGALSLRLVQWRHDHRPRPEEAPTQNPPPVAETPPAAQAARPQQVQPLGAQLFRNLIRQLDLSDSQRAVVNPIVRKAAFELGQERREAQFKASQIIEKMEDDIAAVLNPEQRKQFDELIAKQRERLRQFRQPGPPQPARDASQAQPAPPPPPAPN